MEVGLAFKKQRLLAGGGQDRVFGAVVFTMLLPSGGQLHGLANRIFLARFQEEVSLRIVGQNGQAGHGRECLLYLLPVAGL